MRTPGCSITWGCCDSQTSTFAGRNKGRADPVKVVAVSGDTAVAAGGGQ